jgi:ADP-ribose pyrophosphatase
MSEVKHWKIIGSKKLNHYKIFETRTDRVVSPRTQEEHDVYVVTGSSWVNILALTDKSELVIVRQYRHGTRDIHWEIPGGVIDSGESPAQAASRELLEETGYQGDHPLLLGKVHPNPAYQENTCYTLLIENARLVSAPKMDAMEDIVVKLIPEADFSQMIESGEITHSLVVVADLWRRLWRTGAIKPIVV